MPYIVGHLAFGSLVVQRIKTPDTSRFKLFAFLLLLVVLPDFDVPLSYLATGDPWILHRNFTHSILFSVFGALVFANIYRLHGFFPKLSYKWCYWAISSHVIADHIFSPGHVMFLWPLPVMTAVPFNGLFDFASQYSSISHEIQVVLICAFAYAAIYVISIVCSSLKKIPSPIA